MDGAYPEDFQIHVSGSEFPFPVSGALGEGIKLMDGLHLVGPQDPLVRNALSSKQPTSMIESQNGDGVLV